MKWELTREGNYDTYVLEMKDATLKVLTAMPNGSFEKSMGLIVLETGALTVFDADNNIAYGSLEKIKKMTIQTYKNKEKALEAFKQSQPYGNLIFQ